jgi:hypothetical protein
MKFLSLKLVFASLIVLTLTPSFALSQQKDQAESPCDSEDGYAKTMKRFNDDTSATSAEVEQIQKIKSLFKKQAPNTQAANGKAKPGTAPAKSATTGNNQTSTKNQLLSSAAPGGSSTNSLSSMTQGSGAKGSTSAGSKPCPSGASGTTAGKKSFTDSGTPAAGTSGKASGEGTPHTAAAGNGTLKSLTLLPNGKYVLAYTVGDTEPHDGILLRKIPDPTSKPENPNDGLYQDDKNYYTVSGNQLTVTPMSGSAAK